MEVGNHKDYLGFLWVKNNLSSFDINNYIKSDDSLDYQKIYKDMEKITGFLAQKRREDHYKYVVGLFESRKKGELLYNAGKDSDSNEVPF